MGVCSPLKIPRQKYGEENIVQHGRKVHTKKIDVNDVPGYIYRFVLLTYCVMFLAILNVNIK